MARNPKRFTVFDAMQDRGVFDNNPANSYSEAFEGPVPYPKMLYHPKGEFRVTVPAEIVMTPMGPTRNNEQRELVYVIVKNEAEHKRYLEEGWHETPNAAMAAAGMAELAESPSQEAARLRVELAKLQAQISDAQARELALDRERNAKPVTSGKAGMKASPVSPEPPEAA